MLFLVPAADAAVGARPPVVWLKGAGNFTPAHRQIHSVDRVVVHVTEGSFWGSVSWLRNPRAHASSHYVVSRRGKIVQLVHLSDIAWHAGHWGTNEQSIGVEHEGFTYGRLRLHERAVPRLGAPHRVDRAALAAADRPQARDRPSRGPGRPRRPRRREPSHRSRPQLEVEALPEARPPLRRRHPPEREAARAGRAAAGDRLLARQSLARHQAGRVHRRRPRRPRRRPEAVRLSAQHDQAGEPRLQAAGARHRRPRPLRRRGCASGRGQQDVRSDERRARGRG